VASGHLLTLHAAGSIPTLTMAKADYPLTATPADIVALAQGLVADLAGTGAPPDAAAGADPVAQWRARAAAALHADRGSGLVIAGAYQPVEVQEAAHRLNAALGNAGHTVVYTAPIHGQASSLADLVDAMNTGSVDVLVVLDGNPAYDAFGSLNFLDALRKVRLKIHAGGYVDETGLRADWHLPLLHPLEAWGDARSCDGTVGLMQPTIAPLYDGRSASEILSLFIDPDPRSALDLLRGHWRGDQDEAAFAPKWEAMLRSGFIPDSALPPRPTALSVQAPVSVPVSGQDLTVLFRPDPAVWTGRFADNPWLQELPRPLTKIVWDNALLVAPALAEREKLRTGDVVTLQVQGRSIDGPVWVLPGQADNVVGLTLGYGRSVPGQLSADIGYDANRLRDAASPWQLDGARLSKTGRSIRFATTQEHGTMEGHDFVRTQVIGASPAGETTSWEQPSLYASKSNDGRAWGMVIDLDMCIGCNACVTACQAENNIAVVGREQVAMGRQMHWLRIDRYYEGPTEAPRTKFQPVPCMHCEDAPCEVGCPVEATLHDQEGLNLMVYNRCVGTRACSGYCPYKVRRFNYYDYSAGAKPSLQLQRNPEVTVRARGVMEKCTYCVQRIVNARIESDKTNAPIADGMVQTACQGACPTQAIVFGDLNDQTSAVNTARHDQRNYALLGELNVRPRTTYLAALAPAPDQEAS
jgi:molybdopterin-containing oxidoreductase family iron-sulfur binding subunit